MTKTRRPKLLVDRNFQRFLEPFSTATCSKSASLFDVDGCLNLATDRQAFVEEQPDADIAVAADLHLKPATVATRRETVLAPTATG